MGRTCFQKHRFMSSNILAIEYCRHTENEGVDLTKSSRTTVMHCKVKAILSCGTIVCLGAIFGMHNNCHMEQTALWLAIFIITKNDGIPNYLRSISTAKYLLAIIFLCGWAWLKNRVYYLILFEGTQFIPTSL
jgi:hypothetical protein